MSDEEINKKLQGLGDKLAALKRRVEELEGIEYRKPDFVPSRLAAMIEYPQPEPKPAEWSNAEPKPRDWEEIDGKPGWFRDPQGFALWAKKGQVPKSVLERFNYYEETDQEAGNSDLPTE